MEPYRSLSSVDDAVDPKARPASGKVRKRAAKACLSCRARKVRCDVSLRGAPCMNCHLDNEKCVVTGRASRFSRHRRDTNEDVPSCAREIASSNGAVEERGEATTVGVSVPESSTGSVTTDAKRESVIAPQVATPHSTIPQPPISNPPPCQQPSTQINYHPAVQINPWSYQPPLRLTSDVVYTHYAFLSITNLTNILPQDVNFLESQDCLRVPTRAVMNEFLQQYFLHVHPLLPLFNEGDFWDMYLQEGLEKLGMVRGRLSLLVLQSLLFAACNFVGRDSIKALGFPSIRAARAALYRRAKLLYDFESESSPTSIAQAALLLSFWSHGSGHGARKPNSHWLNVAIQHAKVAEAHHYPSIDISTPSNQRRQNILKRIWWCCVVRDRVMSLCVRRTVQITEAHFDFYGNDPLSPDDLADEFGRSKVYEPETKKRLAEILANVLDLFVLLTDVLVLVYPLDERPGWGRQMKEVDMVRLKSGREELGGWYNKTAVRFPVFGGGGGETGEERDQHDSVVLYTNLMYMYYHSSRVALCHHEVLHLAVARHAEPTPPVETLSGITINANRQELQDAATGVTDCLKELIQRRLARWLPSSAMACTALPLVLYILDVKLSSLRSASSSLQSSQVADGQAALKQHRLNILIEAMKTYQPQYDGVDKISDTIRHIVGLAQLDGIPPDNGQGGGKIRDWSDILTSHPSLYLRLALTMDLSLSKDRLPEEGDFPASLRGLLGGGGGMFGTRGQQQQQQQEQQPGLSLSRPQQQPRETGPSKDTMKQWLEGDRSCNYGIQNGLDMDLDHQPEAATARNTNSRSGSGSAEEEDRPDWDGQQMEDVFQPFTLEEMDVLEAHVLDAFTLQNESPNSSADAVGFFGRALGDDAAAEWFLQIQRADGAKEGGEDETARVLLEALKNGS